MRKNEIKTPKKGSPMDAALSFLGYRARTVREVERHLDEKQFGEVEIYEAVEKLKDYGYLDDDRYASDFVSSHLKMKPVSRRKLMMDLNAHELPKEVIEEALSVITDEVEEENAYQVALKYYDSYSELEPYERKTILSRRIVSRGFDFGTARTAIERIEREHIDD